MSNSSSRVSELVLTRQCSTSVAFTVSKFRQILCSLLTRFILYFTLHSSLNFEFKTLFQRVFELKMLFTIVKFVNKINESLRNRKENILSPNIKIIFIN